MSGSAAPVVECRDLTHVYGDESSLLGRSAGEPVRALDGVALRVAPGEVVGIAGPSGSGKSTLLHLLSGLATPTEGSVRVGDVELSALGPRRRARERLRRVGQVFQRFHLLPALTARENVALPLVERGVPRAERRRRAAAALEQVGLGDRTDHRPSALSGGERQRVAVARALVTEPDLVVADEPTGELDTETGATVLDHLADAGDDRAVVIASHDERALARTDRVVRLLDGVRVDDGRAERGGAESGARDAAPGGRRAPSDDAPVAGAASAHPGGDGSTGSQDGRSAGAASSAADREEPVAPADWRDVRRRVEEDPQREGEDPPREEDRARGAQRSGSERQPDREQRPGAERPRDREEP